MKLIVVAWLFLLAACSSAPQRDINTVRGSWQGATYEDVVTRWGTPVRSTRLPDGRDVYTWVSESTAPRSSFWPSIGIFGGSGGVGIGTGVTMGSGGGEWQRCERTLIFQDGRVVEQTWQGPADYCSQFARA